MAEEGSGHGGNHKTDETGPGEDFGDAGKVGEGNDELATRRELAALGSRIAALNVEISDLQEELFRETIRLSGLMAQYRLIKKTGPPKSFVEQFDTLLERYVRSRKKL